jgi:hypothetical protein
VHGSVACIVVIFGNTESGFARVRAWVSVYLRPHFRNLKQRFMNVRIHLHNGTERSIFIYKLQDSWTLINVPGFRPLRVRIVVLEAKKIIKEKLSPEPISHGELKIFEFGLRRPNSENDVEKSIVF